MNIDSFLAHYQITENPYGAEEARLDPVFERLIEKDLSHPEFGKVMGKVDQPGTSIVFGEKGSGKTAIRIMLANQIARHNAEHPDKLVLTVPYDDLNPVLDQLLSACGGNVESMLDELRLEDHQDAILSIAVTQLNDALLGEQSADPIQGTKPAHNWRELKKKLRKLPRSTRVNLAVLSALYDQPKAGAVVSRWKKLRGRLGLGWKMPVPWAWIGVCMAILGLVALGGAYAYTYLLQEQEQARLPVNFYVIIAGILLAFGIFSGVAGIVDYFRWRYYCKDFVTQMPAIKRDTADLSVMLQVLGRSEIAGQPIPTSKDSDRSDSRYQLTRQFIEVLTGIGYAGIVVLVDRVDEPTVIQGKADRMRAIIWPMLDNKFLQQKGVGIKLLLPIELRHLVHRESPAFFEEARLDKQHVVDRLTWSGATLYDICTSRLRACRTSENEGDKPIQLMDLFQPDVTRDAVIDALDQMQQPRDAFKFLYSLIQEHCRLSPEDDPNFKIARITLDNVRRAQAQRVQDLQRGIAPA